MTLIALGLPELSAAGLLVVALGLLAVRMELGVSRQLLIAAGRSVLQLLLIGLVLKAVFDRAELLWVGLIVAVMWLIAGYEVRARQHRRLAGWWGYGLGTLAMFVASFAVILLALLVIVRPDPWYQPQYAIPLLGMLLGNTMNGIGLALDRLTDGLWQQRDVVEARLMLGETALAATGSIRREAVRSGLMPIINAMAAAGVVSLPGMMTGQILAGVPPVEAVKYQILILFLIAAGSGFGTLAAVSLATRRLFDHRQRLRLDRLQVADGNRGD
jgi:putative ABC transport system permease protein